MNFPETGGLLVQAFKVVFGNIDSMIIILGFGITMALLLTVNMVYERTKLRG